MTHDRLRRLWQARARARRVRAGLRVVAIGVVFLAFGAMALAGVDLFWRLELERTASRVMLGAFGALMTIPGLVLITAGFVRVCMPHRRAHWRGLVSEELERCRPAGTAPGVIAAGLGLLDVCDDEDAVRASCARRAAARAIDALAHAPGARWMPWRCSMVAVLALLMVLAMDLVIAGVVRTPMVRVAHAWGLWPYENPPWSVERLSVELDAELSDAAVATVRLAREPRVVWWGGEASSTVVLTVAEPDSDATAWRLSAVRWVADGLSSHAELRLHGVRAPVRLQARAVDARWAWERTRSRLVVFCPEISTPGTQGEAAATRRMDGLRAIDSLIEGISQGDSAGARADGESAEGASAVGVLGSAVMEPDGVVPTEGVSEMPGSVRTGVAGSGEGSASDDADAAHGRGVGDEPGRESRAGDGDVTEGAGGAWRGDPDRGGGRPARAEGSPSGSLLDLVPPEQRALVRRYLERLDAKDEAR